MTTLKVLDLFAGTGSATKAFADRGHEVKTVEYEERFRPHYLHDMKQFAKNPETILGRWRPDIIWASPPCTAFSMAGKGSKNAGSERWAYANENDSFPFFGPRLPTDETSRVNCALVLSALHIIKTLKPRFWWLENPMGGLRTMEFMRDVPGGTIVTYCQYGDSRMKPTSLWGKWPAEWTPKPRCYNGDSCHESAPRGARTGTQGLQNAELRAMIPYELSMEICVASETATAKRFDLIRDNTGWFPSVPNSETSHQRFTPWEDVL